MREGHDLIIGPMHYERRNLDFLQIVREVVFRKGLHAVVMRLCTSDHALTPPVLDQSLADLCTVAIEAVEGPGRDIEIELRTILGERFTKSIEHVDRQPTAIARISDHHRGHRSHQKQLRSEGSRVGKDSVRKDQYRG